MNPVLDVWNLAVRYPASGGGPVGWSKGPITVIEGITFRIAPGTTLGLVGESGSGKTTLSQAILGLAPMAEGHVLVNGEIADSHALALRPRDRWRAVRRHIGVTFQDPVASLDPRMTIGDSIAEPFVVHGLGGNRRAEAARLLEQVGLSTALLDRYPHQISGGQARRVSMARAIALDPRLLIADEPTAGLDLSVQGELLNLLIRLQTEFQLGLLLITHNLSVARQITDRIAIMYLGRIVEIGPTAAVFGAPRHPYTQALVRARGGDGRARPLPGELPSLARRPDGCEFHTRCAHAQPRCRIEAPPDLSVSDEHQVRCHFPLAVTAGDAGPSPSASAEPASSARQAPPDDVGDMPGIARRRVLALLAGGGAVAGAALLDRRDSRSTTRRIVPSPAGRVLRIQNDGDITCLDPANRGGWYDQSVINAIFCGLCQFDGGVNGSWSMDAARTLTPIDDRTLAFAVRPGLVWSGGFGEVTAHDVQFSYQRFADPRVQSVYRDDWAALDRVEVTGRYTGLIRLKRPDPALLSGILPDSSGLIVCREAVEQAGGRIRMDPLATCGPYRLADWEPRTEIVLVRHDGWNGPRPYYDEIRLKVVQQERIAHFAFDAGDLDMTKIEPGDIASVRAEHGRRSTLTVRPALGYTYLGMNTENTKLRDIRIRRAIQQAIDPQAIIDATFGPHLVTRAFGLIPPALPGARDRLLYPHDPVRARRLLAEAGADGVELSLTFSHDIAYATAAQVIQSQLADVGIRLRLDQGDGAAQGAQQQDTGGGGWRLIELFLATNSTNRDPGWVTTWFTCAQVGHWNWARICSPAWDALNQAAAVERDPARRRAMYIRLQDMMEEAGGYAFLYHGVNAWVTRPDIVGAWTSDGSVPILKKIRAT